MSVPHPCASLAAGQRRLLVRPVRAIAKAVCASKGAVVLTLVCCLSSSLRLFPRSPIRGRSGENPPKKNTRRCAVVGAAALGGQPDRVLLRRHDRVQRQVPRVHQAVEHRQHRLYRCIDSRGLPMLHAISVSTRTTHSFKMPYTTPPRHHTTTPPPHHVTTPGSLGACHALPLMSSVCHTVPVAPCTYRLTTGAASCCSR